MCEQILQAELKLLSILLQIANLVCWLSYDDSDFI